jgi:hypothetical protein
MTNGSRQITDDLTACVINRPTGRKRPVNRGSTPADRSLLRSERLELVTKTEFGALQNGVINAADPSLKDRIAELSAIRRMPTPSVQLGRSNVLVRPSLQRVSAGLR